MPYQPRVTQGFQTNYAPAMAHFGQQIAQGIREGQRKREEKKQKDSAMELFQSAYGMSKEESQDAVNSFDNPADALKFFQLKENQEEMLRQDQREFTWKRNQAQLEALREKNDSILKQINTEFDQDLAVRKQELAEKKERREAAATSSATRFSKDEIGKSQPVEGMEGWSFIPTSTGGGQLVGPDGGKTDMEIGETKSIKGRTWVWTGSSLQPNEGPVEDVLDRLGQAQRIWSSGDFQKWYDELYDKKGNRKKGIIFRGTNKAQNEMFEAIEGVLGKEIQMIREMQENGGSVQSREPAQAEPIDENIPEGWTPELWSQLTDEEKASLR